MGPGWYSDTLWRKTEIRGKTHTMMKFCTLRDIYRLELRFRVCACTRTFEKCVNKYTHTPPTDHQTVIDSFLYAQVINLERAY